MKLYTAIIQEMNILKTFSAHDLTVALRAKLNSNELDIPELIDPTEDRFQYNLSHNAVKDIVGEIYTNLQDILPLTRNYVGGAYWVYSTVTNNSTATSVISGTSNLNILAGNTTEPPIMNKVSSYVTAKKTANQVATLRGAHSSIKQKGVTIVDIEKIALNLGYAVTRPPGAPYYKSEIR